jgi:hypothetical protein
MCDPSELPDLLIQRCTIQLPKKDRQDKTCQKRYHCEGS